MIGTASSPSLGATQSTPPLEQSERKFRSTRASNFAQRMSVSQHLNKGSKRRSIIAFSQDWPEWRKRCFQVMESSVYDYIMGATVIANIVVMVFETNDNASCEGSVCTKPFYIVFNTICLVVYTLEVLARFAVYRWRVLRDAWSVVDIAVVVLGLVDAIMSTAVLSQNLPKTSSLKAVRVFRLMCAFRFVQYIPALQGIVRGFASAMSAMFWGIVCIMFLVFLVSIATVELVHPAVGHIDSGPDNEEWCRAAFSSVAMTMLFFTQTVIAADSWGECIIPVSRYNGGYALLFTGVTVAVQLGVMNLILSAVVEEANKAHDKDLKARGREQHEQDVKTMELLGGLFADLDKDGSGDISEDEFVNAYGGNPEMQKLFKVLNISSSSLVPLFRMMDHDRSGTISYDEFLTTMRDAQLTDMRMQLMTLKLQGATGIRMLEDVHGIPKHQRLSNCLRHSEHSESAAALARANEVSRSASERPRDHHVKQAADNEMVKVISDAREAAVKSMRASSSASGSPEENVLSCADAEDSKSRGSGLPVVADGSGPALDDFKPFLDTIVDTLDDELCAFRKCLRQQVKDVVAATLLRTAPFSKTEPPPRRDLAVHEWASDDSGLHPPSLPSPPLKPASRDALIVLRESSRAAPVTEDTAGTPELAKEVNRRRVAAATLPHSTL